MSYQANPSGIGVGKTYGGRTLYEHSEGQTRTAGYDVELVLEFNSENFTHISKVIPEGAIIKSANADVVEEFTFTGGSTPTIDIGTEGSEATNGTGLDLTSAGVEEGTLAGTWTSALTADTTVAVTTSGSPTSVDAGKARVIIVYTYYGDLDGQ